MTKVEDIELVVVEALNFAISNDYILITGGFGVMWDSDTSAWAPEYDGRRVCDIFGAIVLANGGLDPEGHRASIHRAVRMVLEPSEDAALVEITMDALLESDGYKIAQGLLAGWDDEVSIFGNQEAFSLGRRLAQIYRPMSTDLLTLTEQVKFSLDAESDPVNDLDDDSPMADHGSGVHTVLGDSEIELLVLTELEASAG